MKIFFFKTLLFLFVFFCLNAHAQKKIVTCVGASITSGGRIKNPQVNSYPAQLQAFLGADYIVNNFGVGSSTMLRKGNSPYWDKDAYQQALKSNPDIVFIDLGGNDAKAINRPFYDELEQDTRDMIRSFKTLPSHPRVILLLPTAFFETNQNEIYDPVCRNEVAPRLRNAADKEGVEVLDMYPLLVDRPDLVPDRVHPEEEGSAIMAKRMYQQVVLSTDKSFDSDNSANKRIVANPMNLNYRFQYDDPSRREAADPVLEYFKGKYYLFASKSGGYWSSPDLAEWKYIPCKTIETIENYAPAILVLDDELYYMGSGGDCKIYKNSNPDKDNWQLVDSKLSYPMVGSVDPAFFRDDDKRVYLYWGCSDKDPIIGVEVDPTDGFKVIGEAKVLINHHSKEYGWEEKGAHNDLGKDGYNEGPCLIKHKGKYYLQYAAPGTEVRVYGDGVYVSDAPLGPYTYEESSPFSFKPGGFIGGAGHGHTFRDKYGNLWHVASMKIAQRHMFERRLGLFPVYFSNDDALHSHTVLTDYPYAIPDKKIDFEKNDLSMNWNLLSYRKNVETSSALPAYEAEKANDEQVETWWSAATGKVGEWWKIDLGKPMQVNAIQVNFADHDCTLKAPKSYVNYLYTIDCSDDGVNWKTLVDRSDNIKDSPHDFILLDKPVDTRYLRITNQKVLDGKFSMYDFRVFGHGKGKLPPKVKGFTVKRKEDRRRFYFSWDKADRATGYIIHWGVKKDRLKNASMVMDDVSLEAGYFNRDSEYFFTIDSFNENGITKGREVFTTKQ